MPRGLAALAALFALIAVQAAVGATPTAQTAPAAHNPMQFPDGTAEPGVGAAADMNRVTILNTTTGGIRLHIAFSNRPTSLNPTDVIFVPIDADNNPSTGQGGFEFLVIVTPSGAGLFRWDGTTFVPVKTLTASFSQGQQVEVPVADLGNTTRLNFWALTFRSDGPADEADIAPEGTAIFNYTLAAPHIESLAARTPNPRAGRRFTVTNVMAELSTDEQVRPTYRCTATLKGKRLRGRGTGGCSFAIPRNTAGQRLVLRIIATVANGEPETFSRTFRVRR